MARVNVEQKALIDPRFGMLGIRLLQEELGNDAAENVTTETARCVGIGRMCIVWNSCIETGSYTLTEQQIFILLGTHRGVEFLLEANLAERVSKKQLRLKGTEGRTDYLEKKRVAGETSGHLGGEFGHLGAAHGVKGGRPRTTPVKPPVTGGNETPVKPPLIAPALTPASKEESTPLVADAPTKAPRKSAKQLVEELSVDADLRTYGLDIGVSAEGLIEEWRDYYRSNGYRVGKNPIANARASLMGWMRRAAKDKASKPGTGKSKAPTYTRIEDSAEFRETQALLAGKGLTP